METYTYHIWVPWNMSEPAYGTNDLGDALTEFGHQVKQSDGMQLWLNNQHGTILAEAPEASTQEEGELTHA
jgi:hypothetical protein